MSCWPEGNREPLKTRLGAPQIVGFGGAELQAEVRQVQKLGEGYHEFNEGSVYKGINGIIAHCCKVVFPRLPWNVSLSLSL